MFKEVELLDLLASGALQQRHPGKKTRREPGRGALLRPGAVGAGINLSYKYFPGFDVFLFELPHPGRLT